MKVLGNMLQYPSDGLWKDYCAVICFYSSTKAVFDLGTMTLLFPLLASPVLLSRPVVSKLNDSVLELLFAHERCFSAEGCFASDISLVVFLCFCYVG